MSIRTCLLVTDDPDDHSTIAEALAEVSENTILLNILDSKKALQLLKEEADFPHYVILDLSMHGIKINSIVKTLKAETGSFRIPTIVYGQMETFLQIEERDDLTFFDKDYSFSELREFLERNFRHR